MTLDSYLLKTDDELYELLGAELLGDGVSLSPEDKDEHRRFGRQWFGNKRRELQRKICHHEKLKGLLGNSTSDLAIDAAAIYETLQNLGEDAVNAAVLAVLVARVGLGAFCANAPAA
ncbi:hypothetical protein [Actinophytocola oryzae]|uniref:Uncharacterized protein n=1 Tax=Actinophytocola oryzae TaxID=502181 RepID=A0A4R7V219_9PSEU|nr:hypothetical protein [Actinophytocola oryzae]TDV42684.1 hypothetical protein CLV71_117156 [Actinophytocola oryzae]